MKSPQVPLKPWTTQTQSDPPDFGASRRIPRWRLNLVTWRRRARCRRIVEKSEELCQFEPGLVSLVILSCRRLPELTRLCSSLTTFLAEYEAEIPLERILVDNGSGPELLAYARSLRFFDRIIAHPTNLGMATALNDAYQRCTGEYVLLLEDDFILAHNEPFLARCIEVLEEYPEIGIVRLKNQNNWGKPFRRIGPIRTTSGGTEFWTWLPSPDGAKNVWAAGSVLFRKASFFSVGLVPEGPNVDRSQQSHQGNLYEYVYGRRYNKVWLAAKVKDCYPFVQPNDNADSPGWGEVV